MKVHYWFKAVFCGVLAGLLVGFASTAFRPRSHTPQVNRRAEDQDSIPATVLTARSRADLFQHLLKPYLTKLQHKGSLSPTDIFKFRGVVASWLCADTPSCTDFLSSVGMAVLLKSDTDPLLPSVPLDPRSVLEEAGRFPTSELRDSFLRTAIPQLAEKNPVEAFRVTHFLPPWLLKFMQIRVAEIWVKKDIRGALQSYFDDETIDRSEVFRYAVRAAGKENLEQTFNLINSWPPSSFQHSFSKESALSDLIASLEEEKDPKLLWACLQKLPESSTARKSCATRLALIEVARGNAALPEGATLANAYLIGEVALQATHNGKSLAEIKGIIDQIPGVNSRSKVYKTIAGYRAMKDPEQAVKWAETIAEPPTRAAAFDASFKEWLSSAPEKAVAYALVDKDHDVVTRRQLNLQILDWAYSEAPDIEKSLLAKGFRQLSPVQQEQVKEQITSTFDPVAAIKVLELFQ